MNKTYRPEDVVIVIAGIEIRPSAEDAGGIEIAENTMSTDEALALAKEYNVLLITGEVHRCYLYPKGTNPERDITKWVGYGDSDETPANAIRTALHSART